MGDRIVTLLVYYKAKIRELEIISEIEEKQKISLPVSLDSKDLEMFNNIFTTIEEHVLIKENFKDSNITISSLASQLSINNNYLSIINFHVELLNNITSSLIVIM